jgi:tetratricopeptide (TPR) repeat protein
MKYRFLSALLIAVTMAASVQGQLKLPALSPTAKIIQDFSVSSIEISYSRPSMRGRKIFGDVVPYGRVWRTGANAPTKIKIGEDMEIAGHKLKAGEYAIYTIPNKDKWEIVFNTGKGNFAADGFPKEDDVARFMVRPSTIDGNCQTFTILITDLTFTTCKIEIVWERTKIVLPVVAHNEENIAMSIDKVVNHPAAPPYFQAANYYFETDQKMDVALSYVNKALEDNPKAFYMWYLKARIEKKLGNKEEAIAAARKSMETAKGSANENEYMHNNQKLLDEIERQSKHRQAVD